jgi:hypothetical protein
MLSTRLHYCSSMADWSYTVKSRSKEGVCCWIGCTTPGSGAAHMFSRKFVSLRLVVENGVWLCTKHHRMLDKAPEKKKLQMIKLLVGEFIYSILYEVWQRSKFPGVIRGLPLASREFEI